VLYIGVYRTTTNIATYTVCTSVRGQTPLHHCVSFSNAHDDFFCAIVFDILVYYKSFLTCLICFSSTFLGTNSLNSADVPLNNKHTKKYNIHQCNGFACYHRYIPVSMLCVTTTVFHVFIVRSSDIQCYAVFNLQLRLYLQ